MSKNEDWIKYEECDLNIICKKSDDDSVSPFTISLFVWIYNFVS